MNTTSKKTVSPRFSILAEAVRLALRGFSVFPLVSGGKKPAVATGFKAATTDPVQIEDWFSKKAKSNIGIATGEVSGIWVLDIDVKNGAKGEESLAAFEAEYGALPPTLTCKTPSGGKHIYFAHDGSMSVKSAAGILPGIDVRGEGGYIVASPSQIDGVPYQWVDSKARIAIAPEALIRLVTEKKSSPTPIDAGAVIQEGTRNDKLMRAAVKWLKLKMDEDDVLDLLRELNGSACNPPLPDEELVQIVHNVFARYGNQVELLCTDKGDAERMADLYHNKLHYVEEKEQWLSWTGFLWRPVGKEFVMQCLKELSNVVRKEAKQEIDSARKKALLEHALKLEGANKLENVLKLFKSEPNILTSVSAIDSHGSLISVANGTFDLLTNSFRAPDPSLLMTVGTNIVFDPDAKAPRWEKFISEVMNENEALVECLQRIVGYCLTNSVAEQCIFFFYGHGANGKSTLLNILLELLGDMGTQAQGELLLEGSRTSSGASPDIARLEGKRLIAVSEFNDGKHLNEAQVKSLTGGDVITARYLFKNQFTFKMTGKLIVASNHKPIIKGTDHGIWRRIHLIPFEVKFEKERQDKKLEQRLREELPGILNWAIEGYRKWRESGLAIPASVARKTAEYRKEMDMLGMWLDEKCIIDSSKTISFSDAYQSFGPWVKEYFNIDLSKNRFGRLLTERGFEKRSRPQRHYEGFELLENLPLKEQKKMEEKRTWRDSMERIIKTEWPEKESRVKKEDNEKGDEG
ncbi:phage/plasmid primase, P4 family [Herbaspirillum huttiense]|uniref:phage/plasmid primase, P4 family n=1 Tax=Herbaspirillum huttiense TaxID=863372 RepID=UPI0018E1E9ED|nr:phage/plasmid primase, P4 family [Herbaspirillum huttiense]